MWTASGVECQHRCLGDHDLKGTGGLTAEPEVTTRDLDDKDTFVVAASDGLWDCISNEEAVNIVHDTGTTPLKSCRLPLLSASHLPLTSANQIELELDSRSDAFRSMYLSKGLASAHTFPEEFS